MLKCPFCKEPLDETELRPGRMATCQACGNRISPGFLARLQPATPAAVEEEDDEGGSEDVDETQGFFYRLRHLDRGTLAALLCGSLALGLPALAALSFSTAPLAYLSKPLSSAGLLVGVLACLLPAIRNKGKLDFPIGVCVLCLVAFLFAGPWPSFRGGPPPPTGPITYPLESHPSEGPRPVKEGEWVDARKVALRDANLRVQVAGARVVPIQVLGAARPPRVTVPSVLLLEVVVAAESDKARAAAYEPWTEAAGPSKHPPVLTDNTGKAYPLLAVDSAKLTDALKRYAAVGAPPPPREDDEPPSKDGKKGTKPKWGAPADTASARPPPSELPLYRGLKETLVFPAPPQNVEYLRLELPASAFGFESKFRFQVPLDMIKES